MNSSYEHSLIENNMDGESHHHTPRGRRRRLSTDDPEDDYENNFRDEGTVNTVVLALTTLIFGIQSSMPKVSYVKAIDWFLCVSFLYVFAALVEYPSSTFVKSQAKKLTRKGTTILRKVKGLKEDPEDLSLSRTRYGSTDKVGLQC